MAKKIRGGAKGRNVRGKKAVRPAEIVWEGHLTEQLLCFEGPVVLLSGFDRTKS